MVNEACCKETALSFQISRFSFIKGELYFLRKIKVPGNLFVENSVLVWITIVIITDYIWSGNRAKHINR